MKHRASEVIVEALANQRETSPSEPTHDPITERLRSEFPDVSDDDLSRLSGRVRVARGRLEVLAVHGWLPASVWIRHAIEIAPEPRGSTAADADVIAKSLFASKRRRSP